MMTFRNHFLTFINNFTCCRRPRAIRARTLPTSNLHQMSEGFHCGNTPAQGRFWSHTFTDSNLKHSTITCNNSASEQKWYGLTFWQVEDPSVWPSGCHTCRTHRQCSPAQRWPGHKFCSFAYLKSDTRSNNKSVIKVTYRRRRRGTASPRPWSPAWAWWSARCDSPPSSQWASPAPPPPQWGLPHKG